MRPYSIGAAAVLAGLLLSATPARAQWIHYPTAGVPKSAAGAPDLAAPTPRMNDGKPDLSGMWGTRCNTRGGGTVWCAPDVAILPEFSNVARSLPGGLPYQPWVKDLIKTRASRGGQDDPFSHCLPGGPARAITGSLNQRFSQTNGMLLILNERNAMYREVWLDGRPLPEEPVNIPSWTGYSTGRWDGDTLVIESNGYNDRIWLDRAGNPLTEKAHITEKYRRVNFGTIEVEFTVNDPGAYTKPWTIKLPDLHLMLDTDMVDQICLENEKDSQLFVPLADK